MGLLLLVCGVIIWVCSWLWLGIGFFMILVSWGVWEKPFNTVLGLSEFAYGGTLILAFLIATVGTLWIVGLFPELQKEEDES